MRSNLARPSPLSLVPRYSKMTYHCLWMAKGNSVKLGNICISKNIQHILKKQNAFLGQIPNLLIKRNHFSSWTTLKTRSFHLHFKIILLEPKVLFIITIIFWTTQLQTIVYETCLSKTSLEFVEDTNYHQFFKFLILGIKGRDWVLKVR